MLRRQDLSAGKCYVNYARKVARVVLAVNDKNVTFITYHLDTGNSCGSASECPKSDFVRWADHEATPVEIAKLRSLEAEALFRAPQSSNQSKSKSKAIDPPTTPLRAR